MVIASIAVVFALDWAQGFLIPLLFGILIAYMLDPVVGWLEQGTGNGATLAKRPLWVPPRSGGQGRHRPACR